MCFQFVSQKPRCRCKRALRPLTGDNSSCFQNLMADRAGSHCLINTLRLTRSNDFNLHKNHMVNCHKPRCQTPAGNEGTLLFFLYFLSSPEQLCLKEIKVRIEANTTFLRKMAGLQSQKSLLSLIELFNHARLIHSIKMKTQVSFRRTNSFLEF